MTQIVLDLVDEDYVDVSTTTYAAPMNRAKAYALENTSKGVKVSDVTSKEIKIPHSSMGMDMTNRCQARKPLDYSDIPFFCKVDEGAPESFLQHYYVQRLLRELQDAYHLKEEYGYDAVPGTEESISVHCNNVRIENIVEELVLTKRLMKEWLLERRGETLTFEKNSVLYDYQQQLWILEEQNQKRLLAKKTSKLHSTPATACASANIDSGNHSLQIHQMEPIRLERRSKQRLMTARQEQNTDGPNAKQSSPVYSTEPLGTKHQQLQSSAAHVKREIMNPSALLDRNLDFVSKYIDSISETLRPISLKIHDNPELNFEEFIAHKTLVDFMKTRKGWEVTPSAYGIATAFIAVYDSGREGPVISYNAEYDALTGIGHACGHNLIAIASLSASLACAAAMDKFSLPGKVILYGTPAEEGGGGKIKLLEAGAYSDHKVDLNLISHPGKVADSVLVRTNAYLNFKVEYFGKEAHAAAAPWEGINALDALITAYNALSVLRQQTMPGDIIQGHITNGGSAPNIIHAYAAGIFVVRALTKKRLAVLLEKVKMCFIAGAQATGAKLKITNIMGYDNQVPNLALGEVCREAMNKMGGSIPEQELDLIQGATQASSDQGNISYAMPSLSLGFAIDSVEGPHNPGFTKSARTMQAHGAALRAGKGLAVTGLQVLVDGDLLVRAKKEFEEMIKHG